MSAYMEGWRKGYLQAIESLCASMATVEGWITQKHLDREDTNAICIWQFPEGQDKEIMIPVTVIFMERHETVDTKTA